MAKEDDEDEEVQVAKGGMSADEIRTLVKSMVAQGKAESELEKYLEQNLKYRQKNRALKEELEETKKKVPADGAVVLVGDDAKEHADVLALGKKAKEIKKVLDSHDELVEKTTKLERTQLVTQIAEAEGWKGPLLERLTTGMDLAIEDVNEDVDDGEGGTKKAQVKRGFVSKKEGANVTKVRLSEELKDLLASLAKEEKSEAEGESGDVGVTPFPKQVRGETGKPSNKAGDLKGAVGKHIGSRYKIPGAEPVAK